MRFLALTVALVCLLWGGSFALSLYLVSKTGETAREIANSCMGSAVQPGDGSDLPFLELEDCDTAPLRTCRAHSLNGEEPDRQVYAFVPHDPVWSLEALKYPCFDVDVLLTESHRVTDVASGPFAVSPDLEWSRLENMSDTRKWRDLQMSPVIRFTPRAWDNWLQEITPDPLRLAGEIMQVVDQNSDRICLWFEGGVPLDLSGDIDALLGQLEDWADRRSVELCLIVPMDFAQTDPINIGKSADVIIMEGFSDPEPGMEPSAPFSAERFQNALKAAVAAYGSEKLVVAMGAFAEDWTLRAPAPERIPFAQAMHRIALGGGVVSHDPNSLLSKAQYSKTPGQQHLVYLFDAISAYNQLQSITDLGVSQVAVWPLGYEDPGVWDALALPEITSSQKAIEVLSQVNINHFVSFEGTGSYLRVISTPRNGLRQVSEVTGTDMLRVDGYSRLPRPYGIQRYGKSFAPVVALTFDDGPDPDITPQILDILSEKQVPAAFFQIGMNVIKSPDITRRIVEEGHEVGSHTFSHPRLEDTSELATQIELNAMQRLLASLTGHRTILFRMPYGRSQGPLFGDEARPLLVLEENGYISVGSDITPRDWEDLSGEDIVQFVRKRLAEGAGNVLVLHDAGGDRTATLEALPLLIDTLRADGYDFVSLGELLNAPASTLMPPDDGVRAWFDGLTFGVLNVLGGVIYWIFWATVAMGAMRAFILLSLAIWRGRRSSSESDVRAVTVLIPAFNEEDAIVDSVNTVLESDFTNLKVIVVDDGSVDKTLQKVTQAFGEDSRVTVVAQPNQGKWKALNNVLPQVHTEIVVAIDADTVLAPDAIDLIVAPFADPDVGAVAGNVRVRRARGILGRLQSIEYIVGQNIDRRAAEVYGGIMVVPGAIGAWRVAAIRKVGLYSGQTVAEDADLTVSVLRAGYKVVFEERAESYTEVPMSIRAFLGQRLRWSLGMMQTAWKHRRAARDGRAVGLISIPDLAVFGVVLPLLSPIADLVVLGTLADMTFEAMRENTNVASGSWMILIAYLALPALDFLRVIVAFIYQRNAPWGQLFLWPFQRLLYQPLLYITVYRAVIRALSGHLTKWGVSTDDDPARQPRQT